jgi:hypothetical protein
VPLEGIEPPSSACRAAALPLDERGAETDLGNAPSASRVATTSQPLLVSVMRAAQGSRTPVSWVAPRCSSVELPPQIPTPGCPAGGGVKVPGHLCRRRRDGFIVFRREHGEAWWQASCVVQEEGLEPPSASLQTMPSAADLLLVEIGTP